MEHEKDKPAAQTAQLLGDLSMPQRLRILRMLDQLGLHSETQDRLRSKILLEEAAVVNSRVGAVSAPEFGADESSYHPAPLTREAPLEPTKIVLSPALTASEPAADLSSPASQETLEAEWRLRQKIETEQSWSAFRREAWLLYESVPRPEMAARLVELALLYGSVKELEDVLTSLLAPFVPFYKHVAEEIRSHLVQKLWQAQRWTILDQLIFRKEHQLNLLPIERLFTCWSFLQNGENDKAYKYFKRYDRDIWSAQKEFAGILRRSENEFALTLASIALGHGDEALALPLLESIPQTAPEFQRALDLLLEVRVERDESGLCPYGQKLQKELDWRARLDLLEFFILRIQRFEASLPRDRTALNELLKDPLRWFPEQAEAWQSVAELLLRYNHLEYLLPEIMRVFLQNSCHFHRPAMDHALWASVRAFEFDDSHSLKFWHGIALVHEFVWGQGKQEAILWEARRLMNEASEQGERVLSVNWARLHRHLVQWVNKSDRIEELERSRLSLLIRLMGECKDIEEQDIHSFLVQVAAPSHEIMGALESLARDRGEWGLELFILERKASRSHYTNADLSRIWRLGNFLKRNDLCWRVASVLKNRQVLNPQLERHWQISGEKRREFPLMSLSESNLKKIFQSFDGHARKLLESLVLVGPLIPELLAALHPQVTALKSPKSLTDTESEIQDALQKASWLIKPKRLYAPNPSGLWQPKPPFFSSLLDSKWSLLYVALAQTLGVSAWDWQISILHHQIESIIPKMMRGIDVAAPGKVGRWLRNLNPSQRKAWYELAHLSHRFDDDEAQSIISCFLARLTTTILQDHSLALKGLEKMRSPLNLRWDLESWIVSNTYGEIRRSMGCFTIGQFQDEIYSAEALAV